MTNILKNERGSCFSKLKKVVGASGVTLIPMKKLVTAARTEIVQPKGEE